MATIDIQRNHTLGIDSARKAAESIAERLKDKLDLKVRWEGDNLKFERSGANGQIAISATTVRVTCDLGLLLRPMKGQIESKVQKYLDEALPAQGGQ